MGMTTYNPGAGGGGGSPWMPPGAGQWDPYKHASGQFGPAIGLGHYNYVNWMNQMLPSAMNPGSQFMGPAGNFFGDYAGQFPGMYGSYMGQLGGMANSPFYGGYEPNVNMTAGQQGDLWNFGQQGLGGAMGRLQEMMGQGGLSNEYVSAMMNQVLEPAQTQLIGKLNSLGGGKANLGTSGLSQNHLANLSSDFMDNLARTGMENYMQGLSQLGGLGQFGASGSLNAYNSLMNTLGTDRTLGLQGMDLYGRQLQWPMQQGLQWASPYFNLAQSILSGWGGLSNNLFNQDNMRLAAHLNDPGWAGWLQGLLNFGSNAAANKASTGSWFPMGGSPSSGSSIDSQGNLVTVSTPGYEGDPNFRKR